MRDRLKKLELDLQNSESQRQLLTVEVEESHAKIAELQSHAFRLEGAQESAGQELARPQEDLDTIRAERDAFREQMVIERDARERAERGERRWRVMADSLERELIARDPEWHSSPSRVEKKS
jgi:hypothetical protein